jgi:hypothetical protein
MKQINCFLENELVLKSVLLVYLLCELEFLL